MCRSLAWARKHLTKCLGRRAILTMLRRLAGGARAGERWRWLAAWFRWRTAATWEVRCATRRIFAMWWASGHLLDAFRGGRRIWEGSRFRFRDRRRAMLRTARFS